MDASSFKQQAAEAAVSYVQSGMVVGLGTGSTAIWAVRHISALLAEGILKGITGIPTSRQTAEEAKRLGVPLSSLESHPVVDLTIDGADEVAPDLGLIKGGGGALLREKIVAEASKRVIIAADSSKRVVRLGEKFYVPVEVIPFGHKPAQAYLESLGAKVILRLHSPALDPFFTDQGNYILDCYFGPLADPADLARKLKARAGLVEHGLFLGIAHEAILAGPEGLTRLTRP
jgi:ribose 5-phosphate isomerase A